MVMAAFVVIDGTVFSIISVLCALFHEAAHIITLKFFGYKMRSVHIGTKGISLKTSQMSYTDEAIVAFSGPIASFLGFTVFVVIYFFTYDKICGFIALSNFALFFLNVLPLYPLDGGRGLFCVMCNKFSREKATQIIKVLSFIFLLPLGVISVIIFLRSGFNLSLFIICVYLLILLMGVNNI